MNLKQLRRVYRTAKPYVRLARTGVRAARRMYRNYRQDSLSFEIRPDGGVLIAGPEHDLRELANWILVAARSRRASAPYTAFGGRTEIEIERLSERHSPHSSTKERSRRRVEERSRSRSRARRRHRSVSA